MSSRKKTILIVTLILLIAIIAFAVYFFFLRKAPAVPEGTPASSQDLESEVGEPESFQASPPETASPEETEKGQVKNLTVSFVERFGSYSNESNFQNLEELKVFMTEKMISQTDNFIEESRRNSLENPVYSAQTTKALSAKEIFYNSESGQAEFTVQCQRQEFVGSPNNPSTYYQDIKITLVKQGGDWKVDSAEWQ